MFCVRKVDFPAKILCARKIKANLKFYHTSAEKSTFHTQNDTDPANYLYIANKKNLLYHVRNVFNRVSKSRPGPRRHEEPRPSLWPSLALKYVFPHLIRNILFLNLVKLRNRKLKRLKINIKYIILFLNCDTFFIFANIYLTWNMNFFFSDWNEDNFVILFYHTFDQVV